LFFEDTKLNEARDFWEKGLARLMKEVPVFDSIIADLKEGEKIQPSVTTESGIVMPMKLGKWERQSIPLHVSDHYKNLFKLFGAYFKKEIKALGDEALKQEQAVLEKL